jgi:hypothetical protein
LELILFVISQLTNDDLSIPDLAMSAVIGFSGGEDEKFLIYLTEAVFL